MNDDLILYPAADWSDLDDVTGLLTRYIFMFLDYSEGQETELPNGDILIAEFSAENGWSMTRSAGYMPAHETNWYQDVGQLAVAMMREQPDAALWYRVKH